ncbi:hypothetical protein B0A55_09178 [Friedmanniomyces simplex]|uniref:Uncharacterized protein n=1 Tax=Friedmanniomyces simplex TaxID=329884 RepID=A0A4U0WW58_9PEZI|nr:hypothetical protein B0A55_09178 [Friedmanniomyces simplex]
MRPEKDATPSRRTKLSILGLLIALFIANVCILNSESTRSLLYAPWLPSVTGASEQRVGKHVWRKSREPTSARAVQDEHPIRALMEDARWRFHAYNSDRSKTFKETVEKYRRTYGRHPPPGFKQVCRYIKSVVGAGPMMWQWYQFACERHVHNIDDFAQINDDLRPFWALPPPQIRHYAAHTSDSHQNLVATISLRQGQVFQDLWGWRSETFVKTLSTIAQFLPDMDIPICRQCCWSRSTNPFWYPTEHTEDSTDPPPDYGYFWHAGTSYMDLAAPACPPESYARNPHSPSHRAAAEASYKLSASQGGFMTNTNLSTDLCTVGPTLAHTHAFLFAAESLLATQKLIPIFSECKVSVNNDILFPANMYWKKDKRYEYDDAADIPWDDKDDVLAWRGVTSGGLAFEDKPEEWRSMQRQRLVALTNATALEDSTVLILAL